MNEWMNMYLNESHRRHCNLDESIRISHIIIQRMKLNAILHL